MKCTLIFYATNTSPPCRTFRKGQPFIFTFQKKIMMNLMLRFILGAFCSLLLCVSCKHKRELEDFYVPVGPYDSTTLSKCFSCLDEKPMDTLTNMVGKIIRVYHDPIDKLEYSWAITVSTRDLNLESASYILQQDSILAPCPGLRKDLRIPGKKVIVSGVRTSCNFLFSCPYCRFLYGRKIIVTNIQAK